MGVGQRRDIIILGSTGSIGRQALEVVAANPDRFRIVGLGAGGGDPELLARQVIDFAAPVVAVARGSAVEDVQLALYAEAQRRDYPTGTHVLPRLLAGPDAAVQLARTPCDVVLNAITGSVGLLPTLATLESGTRLALANKESLIVGGPLVEAAAAPGQLVPVDSEHSAIAQALRGERPEDVRRLVVTASGGPFRGRTRTDLVDVTPEQARAHPTWDMGPVITINSATLVNKGLEVIEAHLLFGIDFDAIDVVVHPTSMVHSMVEFVDGSTIAQASPPDMRLPIALGLGWPERVPGAASACDWSAPSRWEFSPLDESTFPAVRLARAAGEAGRTAPAVYNAANEVCVNAFVAGELPFLGIVDTVESVLEEHLSIEQLSRTDVPSDRDGTSRRPLPLTSSVQEAPLTVDDVLEADAWARDRARSLIQPHDREGAR